MNMPRYYQIYHPSLNYRRHAEDSKVVFLFGLVLVALSLSEIETGEKVAQLETHDMDGKKVFFKI
jgi:hypothetical protein